MVQRFLLDQHLLFVQRVPVVQQFQTDLKVRVGQRLLSDQAFLGCRVFHLDQESLLCLKGLQDQDHHGVLVDQWFQFHRVFLEFLVSPLTRVDLLNQLVQVAQAVRVVQKDRLDQGPLVVPLDLEVHHLLMVPGCLAIQYHLSAQMDPMVQMIPEFRLFQDLL